MGETPAPLVTRTNTLVSVDTCPLAATRSSEEGHYWRLLALSAKVMQAW